MKLSELLGIDTPSPTDRRARRGREADRKLVADLVQRRKDLELSQTEVARRMDTSQSTVARIESGARDLHQSTIRRYAMAVEAVVEHAVVADDLAKARSTAILSDLQTKKTGDGHWQRAEIGEARRGLAFASGPKS